MALYLLREIRHIGIVVKNLDESMYFYKDLMGFEVFEQVVETGEFIEGILNIKNCMVTTVKMIHPCLNGMIELLWYDSPKAKYLVRDINDIGIGHIAFTVDDVMEKFDRLSKSMCLLFQDQGFLLVVKQRLYFVKRLKAHTLS